MFIVYTAFHVQPIQTLEKFFNFKFNIIINVCVGPGDRKSYKTSQLAKFFNLVPNGHKAHYVGLKYYS